MASPHAKLVKCFLLAKQVNHFYWCYTSADEKIDGNWQVSMENIHRIIERMIQTPILKHRVLEENDTVRGAYERYPDHIDIYITRDLRAEWERFSTIKELCHALMDEPSDFTVDALGMLHELKESSRLNTDLSALSDAAFAEKASEYMTTELIYPIEYRAFDKDSHDKDGEPFSSIALRRGIPTSWVELALTTLYDDCAEIWKTLEDFPVSHKLGPPVTAPTSS